MYKLIVILILFILGLYFISQSNNIETFADAQKTGMSKYKIAENCPDVLIQKGSALFLYNSKRGNVPGVNPIRFENLEEYVEFVEWQRSQGILCPVLFLQHAYNAQGDPVYKARPSPTNLQGGLPDYYVDNNSLPNGVLDHETLEKMLNNPNIMPEPGTVAPSKPNDRCDNGSININATDIYPAYNTLAVIKGEKKKIDKTFNNLSPNPMDSNWGGVDFTEKLVQSGYYKDNEVIKSR